MYIVNMRTTVSTWLQAVLDERPGHPDAVALLGERAAWGADRAALCQGFSVCMHVLNSWAIN